MFIGVRTLEPVILDAYEIPQNLRLLVAKTPGQRPKQVKVPIERAKDVAGFMEMVRIKRRVPELKHKAQLPIYTPKRTVTQAPGELTPYSSVTTLMTGT